MATIGNYGSGPWIVTYHDPRFGESVESRFQTREEAAAFAAEKRLEMRKDLRRHTSGMGKVSLYREDSWEDHTGNSEEF